MTVTQKPRDPLLASYLSPKAQLTEEQLVAIVTDALPSHAYRASSREWTWTRPTGIWSLNIANLDTEASMKVRLQGSPSLLHVCVRTTRSEVDAALRFLVAVGAIHRHPDDPTASEKP